MLKKNIAVIVLALIVFSFLSFIGWQYTNLFSDGKIKSAIIPDYQAPDVNSYIARFGKNNKISICKFDLLNPEVVNVYKDPENSFGQIFTIYTKIKRSNILDTQWQIDGTVNDGESSEIYDISFDAVVKEYQQKGCNAFKKNINKVDNIKIQGEGPVSIIYNPPISNEERERLNKEREQKEEREKIANEFQNATISIKAARVKYTLTQIVKGFYTEDLSKFSPAQIQDAKDTIKILFRDLNTYLVDSNFAENEYQAELEKQNKEKGDLSKYFNFKESDIPNLPTK